MNTADPAAKSMPTSSSGVTEKLLAAESRMLTHQHSDPRRPTSAEDRQAPLGDASC